MRRESIMMIWAGGFVLAVALYLVGPDRFLDAVFNLTDTIDIALRGLVALLGVQSFSVIRALAIAIYCVFAVLAILSSQRGHGGIGALIVITFVFMILVWRPYDPYPAPLSRWIVALVLNVAAALLMTQRLTGSPTAASARGDRPPPPYPPGGRLP